MKRRKYLVICLFLAGIAQAKSKPSDDWGALSGPKMAPQGTLIVVQTTSELEPGRVSDRCLFAGVTTNSLTCVSEENFGRRLVFPREQVTAVYRVKLAPRISLVKVILWAGEGFAMGAALTDGSLDYPLATAGAAAGALYGLTSRTSQPMEKVSCIYRGPPSSKRQGS